MKKIILTLIVLLFISNVVVATENNNILVPLRTTVEELGATVEWVKETQNILVRREGLILRFKTGSNLYLSNGIRKEMDKELIIKEGVSLVPIKVIQQEFNLSEEWKDNTISTHKMLEKQLLQFTDNQEMVNIGNSTLIETDNYYFKNPIWVKENGKYVSKIVGSNDMFIRAGTLKKLIKVDEELQKEGYKLVVYVAYRSYELQEHLREHYAYISGNHSGNAGLDVVAKAGKSNHQRGTAVDVKIRRLDGEPVEMPTKYLDFSKKSSVENNKDSEIVKVMQRAFKNNGFKPYLREWWHFDDVDTSKYKHIKL